MDEDGDTGARELGDQNQGARWRDAGKASVRLAAVQAAGLRCRLHAVMANELELFYWWFHDDMTGQRMRTLYAMDRATATELYGNVQPDETTRVVRTVYQLGESVADAERPSNLHAVAVRKVEDATPRP